MDTKGQTPQPQAEDDPVSTVKKHTLGFGQRMRAYFFAGILVIAPTNVSTRTRITRPRPGNANGR